MGITILSKGGALPAGRTKPSVSPLLLKTLGFSHLYIADYAYIDAGGVLRWPDLVTGVEATPFQVPQYQPTRIVEDGVPCISMTSTNGNVCGLTMNQPLSFGNAYTLYAVMDVGQVSSGSFLIWNESYSGFAAEYTNNTTANLNIKHAPNASARSDNNTLGKGARAVTYAGWSAERGSVVFGRDGQPLQAPDALAAAPANAAKPFLLAQGPSNTDGFKGAKAYMIGIVPVDHTTDAYAADRALVLASLMDGYKIA